MTNLKPTLYKSIEAMYVVYDQLSAVIAFPTTVAIHCMKTPQEASIAACRGRILSSYYVLCPWADACLGCLCLSACAYDAHVSVIYDCCVRAESLHRQFVHASPSVVKLSCACLNHLAVRSFKKKINKKQQKKKKLWWSHQCGCV